MPIAIKVENLSKAYQLGEIGTGTISRDLERWIAKVRGKEDPFLKIGETNDRSTKGTSDVVWSLKDINFEINQGDAVGIIGRNGAGKSTLLKLLSRVTSPTTGNIKVKGRIASLLEVGTGFHPELTGRENIYLNGTILGMRRKEIDRKLEEIIDFSGVERYIDTPVKRYSSGMYVRLAFAVAAHLESEILIVDEVLAVGDAEFQKKCLGKMNDVSQKEGRTVIFVSHNMAAVETLCKKGIILQNGQIVFNGSATESIRYYLENGVASNTHFFAKNESQYIGNENIKIVAAKVESADKNPFIEVTADVYLSITLINDTKETEISVGYDLQSVVGDIIFGSGLKAECNIGKPTTLTCHIPNNFLNDGMYSIFFYVHTKSMAPLFYQRDLLTFEVKDSVRDSGYLGKINGAVRPKLNWAVK